VPFQLFVGYFAARYTGITCKTAYYDPGAWHEANRRTVVDFEPDVYWVQTAAVSGPALEILGPRQMRWPGHGVPDNHGHQMIEIEPMKQNEYDAFMQDESDYLWRTYLPRTWDTAAPLAKLPPLRSVVGGSGLLTYLTQLARPEMAAMLETFREAAETQAKWQAASSNLTDELAGLGYPSYNAPRIMAGAPFDTISDNLRGMAGTMMDMYRCPDKLLEACDMLARQRIEAIKQTPVPAGEMANRRVFIALHRGSDGFMSLPQFEKFYWPTLKQTMLALIDAGWIPCPFFEGVWDQRLEYIKDLPKGKVLCHFAQTDPKKAADVLGGHLCFMSDVPASLLNTSPPSEVEDYCKRLIDTCAGGGGFIMTATCLDEARPENVRAMIETTKAYGKY
jgi:hypothetical protein